MVSGWKQFDLENYRVAKSDAFYIPDFINEVEEAYLIQKISESPRHRWKQLANRRLQLLGGELISKNILLAQELPQWMITYPDLMSRLRATGAFHSSPHGGPNHIILNEYLPGQGIMPHEDGPSYYPVVATLSLGSHTAFHYYRYMDNPQDDSCPSHTLKDPSKGRVIDPNPVLTLLLEPRSVVITQSDFYTSHLHGIDDSVEDSIQAPNGSVPPTLSPLNVPIANWAMLTNAAIKEVVQEGGVLHRKTRYSLTCRDVGKAVATRSMITR